MITENMAVALLSERLAFACGYNSAMAKLIKWAAEYHDVGKSMLPQGLLQKPSKLLPHEIQVMKMHTKYGAKLLSSIPGERGFFARQVALLHHEWHNGQGYWGYEATEIPSFVGIVAVADVYTALRTTRVYKQKWSRRDAMDYITDRAGTQFCPKIAASFALLMKNGLDETSVYSV